MSARRLTAGIALAFMAGITSACSSSGSTPSAPSGPQTTSPTPMSAAAYRTTLHQIASDEAIAQHKVQRAFTAHTVTQVRSALQGFAADQRQVAGQLNALTPPADAADANAALAKAFADNSAAVGQALQRASSAMTAKQALAVIQRDRSAQKAGHEIDAALAMLKKLGYTSGS